MMHNLNIAFMAFELLFNDLPFYVRHLPIAILWASNYVCYTWAFLVSHGRAGSLRYSAARWRVSADQHPCARRSAAHLGAPLTRTLPHHPSQLLPRGIVWYSFLDPTFPTGKAITIHAILLAIFGLFFSIGVGFALIASSLPFKVRSFAHLPPLHISHTVSRPFLMCGRCARYS